MASSTLPPPVVVAVDGSDTALGAARWAGEFAARHALPVLIVHALPRLEWHFAGHDSAGHDSAGHDSAEQHGGDGEAILAAAAAAAAAQSAGADLDIRTTAVKGAVATVVAEASDSARLVVIGAGAADHRALGGQAVRIVPRVQCPVVVWRPPVARRTGKPLPVVVGVDESEESARAMAEAFAIAAGLHAPLTVAHMWEITAAVGMGDLGGQGMMDWPLLEVLQTQQRKRLEELVEPLAKRYPNAYVTEVFQDTSPARGLTDLSREAQLVVVGRHGRGRLADALLGSVSQNLIHHAECPVLVVPGAGDPRR